MLFEEPTGCFCSMKQLCRRRGIEFSFAGLCKKKYRASPLFFFVYFCLAALPVQAANPDGSLRIEIRTGWNLVVDSNAGTPSSYAPKAAYISALFCNDGTNTLTDVYANVGDYAAQTPGIYPSRTHMTLVGPLPGGEFALQHEGGSLGTLDATRYIGTLEPGECKAVYWLISYDQLDENGVPLWGPSSKPDDDLWLEYDVWGTANELGSPLEADDTRTFTFRNEISASANKIFPNGANKVPDEYKELLGIYAPAWTNMPVDGSPGSVIITEGIWYDLGNIGDGFDNDGDLIPDRNAWMQPVGDASLFDPSCFRLTRTYAMVVVNLKSGGEQVYVVDDQLYFENIPDNNGAVGYVGYVFTTLRAGCYGQLTPYQGAASGTDNEKFNADYGATLGEGLISGTSRVEMAKSVDLASVLPGTSLVYTVTFTNSGTVSVGMPQEGVPLVVQDSIPSGTFYVAGSATNNYTLPAGVLSFAVLYSTNNGVAWDNVEPAAATNVTDIQWRLSDPLEGGCAGSVSFSVMVPVNYSSAAPQVVNTAGLSIGGGAPFMEDDAITFIKGSNTVGDTVWVDDGSGGGYFGNGIKDGAEQGLANVLVSLYFDADGDGIIDAGDYLIATTNTAAGGTYLFSQLYDGYYIVKVDHTDPDIPLASGPTTPLSYGVSLDAARTNAAPVSFLDADFGFVPVLAVSKTLNTTNTLREGGTVSYTLTVTNRLLGNGTGAGSACESVIYAAAADPAAKPWVNEAAAYTPPYPDGVYATNDLEAASEQMMLTDFRLSPQAGGPTNVKMTLRMHTVGTFSGGDYVQVEYVDRVAGSLFTTNVDAAAMNSQLVNGDLLMDVTTAKAWTWSDFNGTNSIIRLTAQKGGGPDGGSVLLDAAGFVIQSDSTCGDAYDVNTLTPVPLTDTYDARRLRFISATLDPDSTSTNRAAPDQSGWLFWNDIGPIYPGGSKSVTVEFELLEGVNNGAYLMTNRTYVTNAKFLSGSPANSATAEVGSIVYPSGTIGDFVWRDINGDGVQDPGEPGIPNAQVVLFPPAAVDVGGGTGLPVTNTTDASGYYLFTGIPADGTYTVTVLTVTLPGGTGNNTFDADGNHDSSTAVYIDYDSATGGDTSLTNDFGYILATTIEGTIWHDVNRNAAGSRDPGEEWLTNVTVYLCPGSSPCGAGSAIATQQTTSAGYFLFTGNFEGDYVVSVNTNTGMMAGSNWTPSFDTDTTTGSLNYVSVNVVSGGQARADFSYFKTGNYSIGDTLFYDWNGNGLQDASDEGIADITVWLYRDSNTNGIVDYGTDVLVLSTSTSSTGTYLFAGLPATNYLVIVHHGDPDFPPAYTTTADPQGTLDGRSVCIITTSNRLDQDFGYQPRGTGVIGDTVWFDANADGIQSGGNEYGISNVTVYLLADLNGDGGYVVVTTAVTDASGCYQFSALPPGDYKVQVNAADPSLPDDAFGNPPYVTTATNFNAALTNNSYLTADFGFAHLGAIGDTIFWDGNQNGTQDYNEDGISNVTVQLYYDLNSNGVYDSGTDVYAAGMNTDSNGVYLFTGLVASRYVVVVVETGVLETATIMSDPNNDGLPCSDPESVGCDGEYGQYIGPGQNFMGADFGYAPPGVLGDAVWIDTDGDGVFDLTEQGIPYVDVILYSGGVPVATNETDGDGYYLFANLPDGEYWVSVDTNDADFPAGLAAVYDPAGDYDSLATNILISAGAVTNIGNTGCSGCSLDVDFGYRYTGTNTLSGTVGLDGATPDGVMGSGPSGVNADEAPYANVTVYIYLWNDDGDRIPEAGEITLVNQTATSANGDYYFEDLPAGDGDDEYLVTVSAPDNRLLLTTTNGAGASTNVVQTTDAQGDNVSTRQSVPVAPVTVNVDFAYKSAVNYDFGDLPESYSTRIESTPSGARHVVNSQTNLYLGSTIDTEINGAPSADASGDGADEDGVIPLGVWQEGTNGGAVQVTVGAGTGWLVGFVDFNHDGDFLDSGELVANRSVTAVGGGVYTNWFSVPTNSIYLTNSTPYYSRFRLYPSQPAYPALAYSGEASNGEVEDYFWLFGTLGDLVWEDKNADGVQDPGEPGIPGVKVFIDVNDDGSWQDGEPFSLTGTNGIYAIGGFSTGTYSVVVDTNSFPYPLYPVYDLDGTDTVNSIEITVTNGLVRTDLDYGYWRGASIGDYVWDDLNSDGIQDGGEPPMSNITIRLYDSQTNLLLSTTTDAGGNYAFTNLMPATYLVQFVAPPFVQFTSADQGGDDALDSDADAVTGFTGPITLTSGEDNSTVDAGFLFTAAGVIDLGVVKSVSDLIPNEGDSIVYTMVVSNNGPDNATSVVFTDAVPSGITFTNTSSVNYSTNNNLWTIGALNSGSSTTLLIYAVVEAGTSGQTLTNTMRLRSADQTDTVTNNNSSAAVVVVDGTDVGIRKTVNSATINEGETVVYTLVATNTTKNNASGVVMTGSVPVNVTFVSSSSGDYDDGTGLWTIGGLSAYASTSMTITATVNLNTGGTTITNSVSLSDIDQVDIVPTNNSSSVTFYVPLADVGVVKSVSTSVVYETDSIHYTLLVTNVGPDAATSVVVTDALPAGVTFVSSSSADYSTNGNLWVVGSLAAGAATSVTVNVTVNAGTVGTSITNWLAVSSLDQDDRNPTNDTSSKVITVYPYSSLGNFVWIDANTNNVQDVGEGGWTNLTVRLYSSASNLLATTTTDTSGIYSFTNVRSGSYFVEFVPPTYDYVFVVPDIGGNDELDSDANKNTGRTPVFFLAAGTNDTRWDAGLMHAQPGLKITKTEDAAGCLLPGDTIHYTVEIVNTGQTTHSFTLVSDELQPGITYVTNSSWIVAPEDITNTVKDAFSIIAYTNQNGTASWLEDWSSDWTETGEADGPFVGSLKVADDGTNRVLHVGNRNYSIRRSVDLKTYGNTYAMLSFDFRRALDAAKELIYLEVATNGNTWVLLDTFNGSDAAYLSTNYNITSFIGTNTSLRFRTADVSQMGADDILYLDNVMIEFQRRAITTNAGTGPANLAEGYILHTGETLTVTYDVTIDIPGVTTQILNTATVNSQTQPPISHTATVCVEHVDLAIEKFVSDDTPSTNQVIAWTLVITNIGPVETDGVEVTDVLPAKTAYISYGASQGVYSNSTHTWYVGYMDVGDVQTLTITAQVLASSADMITNRAEITRSDVFDIEPTNDWDEVVIYPTLVSITSFRLLRGDSGLVVEWVTGAENGTAGFHLERMDVSGSFVRVNEELLPALFGAPQGGIYQYPDRIGAASAYRIVEVEYNGAERIYGPFNAEVEPAGGLMASVFRSVAHSKPGRARALPRVKSSGTGPFSRLKIPVRETGPCFVTAADIAALMGRSEAEIVRMLGRAELKLDCDGEPVAYRAADSGMYFFAEARETIYSDENVYILEAGPGLRIENAASKPAPVTPGGSFTDVRVYQQSVYAETALFDDPEEDFWLWDGLVAGHATMGRKVFMFDAADPASSGTAVLSVRLKGLTDTPAAADHHARISVNGALAAEGQWNGQDDFVLTAVLDAADLLPQSNALQIEAVKDASVTHSTFYLDNFELSWPRCYRAVQNQLILNADRNPVVTVEGFSTSGIDVWDVTQPKRPVRYRDLIPVAAGGAWSISFRPAAPNCAYAVFAQARKVQPAGMPAAGLKDGAIRCAYLVITDPELAETAALLVAYRRTQGLPGRVFSTEDIYNEFSGGIRTPHAINAFLKYAAENWAQPPQYVLLAGAGSYDYRNFRGYGECLVPPRMVSTPRGLYASDNRLADLNGDKVPDISIGRLPAETPDELKRMISRIVSYEKGGDWKNGILMAADNADAGGRFPADSDALALMIPSAYRIAKTYLGSLNITVARNQLVGELNAGQGILHYIGHASLTQLAAEGLFRTAEQSRLTNDTRAAFAMIMSCTAGRFDIPGYDGLTETLLKASAGGASAAWAPAVLAHNDQNVILSRSLLDGLFDKGDERIGDAVRRALGVYSASRRMDYMLDTFTLLGDPATAFSGRSAEASFEEWAWWHFGVDGVQDTLQSGALADPDGDGNANLMEFALNIDPKAMDGAVAVWIPSPSELNGKHPVFSYDRRKAPAGTHYRLEVAGNLPASQWLSGPDAVQELTVQSMNETMERVAVWVNESLISGNAVFVRLRVIMD